MVARAGFAVAYVGTENEKLSYVRSGLWWLGNGICFWLMVKGGGGL